MKVCVAQEGTGVIMLALRCVGGGEVYFDGGDVEVRRSWVQVM